MTRHLLEIDDLTSDELRAVLDAAEEPEPIRVLQGLGMALVFEKASARTRNSMELAVAQLGGHPVTIRNDEVGLDVRESVEDVARTLACYHAAIGARVFAHSMLERMCAVVDIPVVNMLSDEAHPMQALADVLTIRQELGRVDGVTVAYVGDANNVARSLTLAVGMLGGQVRVASPAGYEFGATDHERFSAAGIEPTITTDPIEAASGAGVVYTDVWTSMGQEAERDERLRAFKGFTVDRAVMAAAAPEAIFLHCLPAHRGEEAADDVVDGEQSRIWRQAENRMHASRGALVWLLQQP